MHPGRTHALISLGAATLGESGASPMHPRIRGVWAGAVVAGPALTARCGHGDNLAIHVAVAEASSRGAVVVVDASDVPALGYWGEVLTTCAQTRGLAGLVIDGGVRDVAALEARRFPVFASVVALPGATKESGGSVGGPVRVGGVEVTEGDWVVGDVDGVVVVPVDRMDDVMAAGRARAAREQEMFQALADGASTVDLLRLDPSAVERAGRARP
jgi:4-hydroxy-4-methyl-2-oxoglutarate aldolase